MREMDILLLNYLENYYHLSSPEEQYFFAQFLQENDLDIYAWITKSCDSDAKYHKIIQVIRQAAYQKRPLTQT